VGARGDRERRAVWLLLVLWLAIPLARIAAPKSNFYDANRHFIEYIPALCALGGVGARVAVEGLWSAGHAWLAVDGRRAQLLAFASVASIALLAWPLVEYYPYEDTYFNALLGGLGKAQRRGLFVMWVPADPRASGTEGDYWFTSLRLGIEKIQAMRAPSQRGEPIAICGPPDMLAHANEVADPKPPITYNLDGANVIYVSPREGSCGWEMVRLLESDREILHREERGGGLIYEIVGRRRPAKVEPMSRPTLYSQPNWINTPGLRFDD
jgi:hypothetical protein